MPTLQACAAVISSMGFSHFECSQDTRLSMDSRKAHRFVAINCEEGARKILKLSGSQSEQIEFMLKAIAAQTMEFREAHKKDGKWRNATAPTPGVSA